MLSVAFSPKVVFVTVHFDKIVLLKPIRCLTNAAQHTIIEKDNDNNEDGDSSCQ